MTPVKITYPLLYLAVFYDNEITAYEISSDFKYEG